MTERDSQIQSQTQLPLSRNLKVIKQLPIFTLDQGKKLHYTFSNENNHAAKANQLKTKESKDSENKITFPLSDVTNMQSENGLAAAGTNFQSKKIISDKENSSTFFECSCEDSSSNSSSSESYAIKKSASGQICKQVSKANNGMPIGYLNLEDENGNSEAIPYYSDADCGFTWKDAIRVHDCSADDDHKTPQDIIDYARDDSMNDILKVLRAVRRRGVDKFDNEIVCYKRYRKVKHSKA